MELNQDKIEAAVIEMAAELLLDKHELHSSVEQLLKDKVDKLFAETAEKTLQTAIEDVINQGFDREYRRVDSFGETAGEPTSIRKELERLVSSYWSARVDSRGKPTDSSYNTSTRAEYLMTQICAKDFSDQLKKAAVSVTAAAKDGLRGEIAKSVDKLLDDLFRVKSVQDQGKAEKPW